MNPRLLLSLLLLPILTLPLAADEVVLEEYNIAYEEPEGFTEIEVDEVSESSELYSRAFRDEANRIYTVQVFPLPKSVVIDTSSFARQTVVAELQKGYGMTLREYRPAVLGGVDGIEISGTMMLPGKGPASAVLRLVAVDGHLVALMFVDIDQMTTAATPWVAELIDRFRFLTPANRHSFEDCPLVDRVGIPETDLTFEIPAGWTVDTTADYGTLPSAAVSTNDGAGGRMIGVLMISTFPDRSATAPEFVEFQRGELTGRGFVIEKEEKVEIAGRSGILFSGTRPMADQSFGFRQVTILGDGGESYTINVYARSTVDIATDRVIACVLESIRL